MSSAKSILVILAALAAASLLLLQRKQRSADQPVDTGQSKVVDQSEPLISTPPTTAPATADSQPSFVGRDTCQECHPENHAWHGDSGHAHTFAAAADSPIAKKLVAETFDAGSAYGSFDYALENGALVVRLPNRFGEDPFPLQFALGSGHNAITLLTLLPDQQQNTFGIEHRVSWYGTDNQLDITPGQVGKLPTTGPEFFGATFQGKTLDACVDCHTTSGHIVGQRIVDLIPNVNCERCHGPASEHVRQARASATPPPFAVGRDDWTPESELRLCGTCHRLPSHLTRKELRQYPKRLIKFQPVGLLRSQCFLESDGQMKCTTCHNPHMQIAAKTKAAYQQDCVSCHLENTEQHVACPVSPRDGCVRCHMPESKFEHDITFHDHWIRVPSME